MSQMIDFTVPSTVPGRTLHAFRCVPDGQVRAIVQLSHGMVEFIDRYKPLAEYLAARGILVTGHDHLGHGGSIRTKADYGYFAQPDGNRAVLDDLHAMTVLTKTLYPDDAVSPSLKSKVTEATVVTINRADADVETNDTEIAFNEVRKETSSLPKGQEKVETEGQKGIMETTSLIKRAGDKVISSNVFASWVKKAPVDKVILVGTGSTKSSSSADLGTTVPAGEVQSWAHQYLLDNGYSEADFTAANYIINHESGWSPTATNPTSGAYGLGQAYPGSKMASAGADWQTNYKTQFKWFISYCEQRYGGIVAAYNYWIAHNNY